MKAKELKAEELRIGNYAIATKKIVKIDYMHLKNIIDIEINKEQSSYEPIKLTEDWLIRFELKEFVKGFWQIDNSVDSFALSFRDGGYHLSFMKYKEIKTVHSLQNLYFALVGEELKLINKD